MGDKLNQDEIDDIYGEFEFDDNNDILTKTVVDLFVAGAMDEKKEEEEEQRRRRRRRRPPSKLALPRHGLICRAQLLSITGTEFCTLSDQRKRFHNSPTKPVTPRAFNLNMTFWVKFG